VFDDPMFRTAIGRGSGACLCCDVDLENRDHPEKTKSNLQPTSIEVMKKRGEQVFHLNCSF